MKFPAETNDEIVKRLRRLEGQIRGIQRLVDEQAECRDIVTQLTGIAAIVGWVFVTSLVVFKAIDLLHGMRVTPEEERMGLDRSEHGGDAYPEFTFQETIAPPELLDPVGSNGH